ncbi:MAG: YdeI/OmpD-associated family protein [Caldilineaceae bacterium]
MTQTFEAVAQAMGSQVLIRLPFDPNQVWGQKQSHHVHGTVNTARIRAQLTQIDHNYYLALGPAWRRDTGIGANMAVTVSLAPEGPQIENMAPDIGAALVAEPNAVDFFNALPTFYRKNYVRWIESAKMPETRAKRIAETVALLKAGKREK